MKKGIMLLAYILTSIATLSPQEYKKEELGLISKTCDFKNEQSESPTPTDVDYDNNQLIIQFLEEIKNISTKVENPEESFTYNSYHLLNIKLLL